MSQKTPKVGFILFAIFALLIVSVIVALYLGANEERQESQPLEGQVTVGEMKDYLAKLNNQIGERTIATLGGQKALRQTAAMIEGTLGPLNLGYDVSRRSEDVAEGLLWTTLWVDIGDQTRSDITVIAIPYGESGTAVAFGLGLAEFLVGAKSKKHVRLVFYPPVGRSSVWDRVAQEEETLAMQFKVTGGGDHTTWGRISQSPAAEKISQKAAWAESITVGPERDWPTIELSEKGPMKLQQQAERLIRMMPVLTTLIDEL